MAHEDKGRRAQGEGCFVRSDMTNEVRCLHEPAGNQQPAHTVPVPAGSAPRHPTCDLRKTAVVATGRCYLCRRSVREKDAALIGAAKALTSSATIPASFPTLGIVEKAKVAALKPRTR